MCRGIGLSVLAVFMILIAPHALAAEPFRAVISTEVDETLDSSGFMDRQVLQLWPPDFTWSGSLANDLVFDPGDVFGVETGLDAYHYMGGLHYFSTEVDVLDGGRLVFEDEDLLAYDPSTGGVTEVFDVKNVLGADYGLDAASYFWIEEESIYGLLFSTEVGGSITGGPSFTDGDVLIYSPWKADIEVFGLEEYFGRNVGLDAIHVMIEEDPTGGQNEFMTLLMSTEVDGQLLGGDPQFLDGTIHFKDEDILALNFAGSIFQNAELVWNGVDSMGLGRDVGLDALYVDAAVPEPGTMLLAGFGLAMLLGKLRKKK